MRPTISTNIQNLTSAQTWPRLADIIAVDYCAKIVTVNIKGMSGPRRVVVMDVTQLGTASAPKVHVGNQAVVQRIDDQYIALGFVVQSGRSIGSIAGASPLAAPVWLAAPQLLGTRLTCAWEPVVGATSYELWENTVASPDGATRSGSYVGNQPSDVIESPIQAELLRVNPGFESATLNGWTVSGDDNRVSVGTAPRTGTYSLFTYWSNTTNGVYYVTSDYYPVVAGEAIALSIWTLTDLMPEPVGTTTFEIRAAYQDAVGAVTYSAALDSGTVTDLSPVFAVWTQLSGTDTIPAGTVSAAFQLVVTRTDIATVLEYFDDASIVSLAPQASATRVFAVRAVSADGQTSPFSPWLEQTVGDYAHTAGTAFPASPRMGDQHFRTDLGWWCYYDGTQWLTASEFSLEGYQLAVSANGSLLMGKAREDYVPYVTRVSIEYSVATTNDGSKYWTLTVRGRDNTLASITNVHIRTTAALTADAWTAYGSAPNETATPANAAVFDMLYAKTSTPGNLSYYVTVFYRLIVT